MGRGVGDTATATAAPKRSRSRSVENARRQLVEDFGSVGYRRYADLPEGIERSIADPNLNYINKFVNGQPNPPRPYTELFRYCPNMRGNRAHWIEVNLRFDHETGELFIVGQVRRPAGLMKSASVLRVAHVGKSVKAAIEVAEQMFDETFSAFKQSKAGRHARYAPASKDLPVDHLQVLEHQEHPFRDAEAAIVAHLATEGVPAQKSYKEHVALLAHEYESMEESKRVGYAEVRALGYLD